MDVTWNVMLLFKEGSSVSAAGGEYFKALEAIAGPIRSHEYKHLRIYVQEPPQNNLTIPVALRG